MRSAAWLSLLAAFGCSDVPRAGDPCDSIDDTVCAAENAPTIYACLTDVYEELDCRDICAEDGELFTRCAPSEERGHDVCYCAGPCDGMPREFDGVLGSPCNTDVVTPMCAVVGNVLMTVWCDLDLCAWQGFACSGGFGCRPGCTD